MSAPNIHARFEKKEQLVGWVKPNNFLSAKTVQFCARLMQKCAKSATKVTFGVVWILILCLLPIYFNIRFEKKRQQI